MVKVQGINSALAVNFSVKVAATLKDALTILPAIKRSSKLEVVVIFSYNIHEESLYVWLVDVSAVNACILKEEENQDEGLYEPFRQVLLAPVIFVYDRAGIVNVQAFATKSQSRVWSAHQMMYLPSREGSFRKSVMDPGLAIHLPICYPSAV